MNREEIALCFNNKRVLNRSNNKTQKRVSSFKKLVLQLKAQK